MAGSIEARRPLGKGSGFSTHQLPLVFLQPVCSQVRTQTKQAACSQPCQPLEPTRENERIRGREALLRDGHPPLNLESWFQAARLQESRTVSPSTGKSVQSPEERQILEG